MVAIAIPDHIQEFSRTVFGIQRESALYGLIVEDFLQR